MAIQTKLYLFLKLFSDSGAEDYREAGFCIGCVYIALTKKNVIIFRSTSNGQKELGSIDPDSDRYVSVIYQLIKLRLCKPILINRKT